MLRLDKIHPVYGEVKISLSFTCYSEESREVVSVMISKASENFRSSGYFPVSEILGIVTPEELNLLVNESIETRHRLDQERQSKLQKHFEQWQKDKDSASSNVPAISDRVIKKRYARVNYGKVVAVNGDRIQVAWEQGKNTGRNQYRTWVKTSSVKVL